MLVNRAIDRFMYPAIGKGELERFLPDLTVIPCPTVELGAEVNTLYN
jgi:hypothetical protein